MRVKGSTVHKLGHGAAQGSHSATFMRSRKPVRMNLGLAATTDRPYESPDNVMASMFLSILSFTNKKQVNAAT